MADRLPTENPQDQSSAPEGTTLVAIPTELLRGLQEATEVYGRIFLDSSRTSDEELWAAFGDLEPYQMAVLELVAKAPITSTETAREDSAGS